jgi:hypothetical protein
MCCESQAEYLSAPHILSLRTLLPILQVTGQDSEKTTAKCSVPIWSGHGKRSAECFPQLDTTHSQMMAPVATTDSRALWQDDEVVVVGPKMAEEWAKLKQDVVKLKQKMDEVQALSDKVTG